MKHAVQQVNGMIVPKYLKINSSSVNDRQLADRSHACKHNTTGVNKICHHPSKRLPQLSPLLASFLLPQASTCHQPRARTAWIRQTSANSGRNRLRLKLTCTPTFKREQSPAIIVSLCSQQSDSSIPVPSPMSSCTVATTHITFTRSSSAACRHGSSMPAPSR